MQLVMAAMTTSPSRTPAVVGSEARPRSARAAASDSGTSRKVRVWVGREGPATVGATPARSNGSTRLNAGAGLSGVRNSPWARQ